MIGHAEIFTNNLNSSTHYGEGCFGSHGVHNPSFALAALDAGIDAVLDVILGSP